MLFRPYASEQNLDCVEGVNGAFSILSRKRK